MCTDFPTHHRILGGGIDRISSNSVLCFSVFHFCCTDDFTIWISAFVLVDGTSSSKCAGAISGASFAYGVRTNDGAQSKVCFKVSGAIINTGCDLGCGDVTINYV